MTIVLMKDLDAFLVAKQGQRRSPDTIMTYRRRIGKFLCWLTDQSDQTFTRTTLHAYNAWLATQPITITSHFAYMNDVTVWARWLMDEHRIERFATEQLKPTLPQDVPAHYSQDQLIALFTHASVRERAIMAVLLDSGIRVSELIQLRRDSFNADGIAVIRGKGRKDRTIWISELTRAAVDQYLATRTDSDPCLWMGRRKPLKRSGIHDLIDQCAERAGIRSTVRRLVHSFRSTFAYMILDGGASVETLRTLLGHESILMSLKYARRATTQLVEQRRRIDIVGQITGEDGHHAARRI